MSELKAVQGVINGQQFELYFKSEADKVFAELKDKLQAADKQIENLINSASSIMLLQDRVNDNICAESRHHKYKRCLAMARWCEDETEINHNSAYEASEYLPSREDYFRRREEHYEMWRKRWLKLAEQFKPNNSTAQ